ncbi:GNAT family N-acetyltransferase [Amorphoplanes nipponensis]|uniref:N-acetyltransferase n=1 Tax=Actinoplanes nipponensis TaxID=135950 RepID=A0A919JI77_9ACTN|nr:GNAT family N-acetyltransferase [Actinoplanes nipponensis]GIE51509.1 N-acetyltransferase [Actinoplanes nipponensis]
MIAFRPAGPEDLSVVADLLYEVEAFYGTVEMVPRHVWQAQIALVLRSPSPPARVLLAVDDAEVVGFASYTFLWPAVGVSTSLFVKELYVREPHRGHGVGTALMAELSAIALEAGSSRLEWTTDADNTAAQAFYAKLDAPQASGKVMYRATSADLVRLSQRKID